MNRRERQISELTTVVENVAQIFEEVLACARVPYKVGGRLSTDGRIKLLDKFVQVLTDDGLRFRVAPQVFFDVFPKQSAVQLSPGGEARVDRQSGARQNAEIALPVVLVQAPAVLNPWVGLR